jgi:hypothetical protein
MVKVESIAFPEEVLLSPPTLMFGASESNSTNTGHKHGPLS